jgi:UDP-N-acetylmuramoyl-tripeptide--D-alanyl-D-alanine ligase
MRILDGIDNSIIIDDTYNASPKAVEHGIETVAKIKNKNKIKKIFVLGDMLELGLYTRDEHYRIGKLVAEACDILITSGIRAKIFAEGALDAGMKDENIFMCDNSILAGKQLLQILEELKEDKFKSGLSEKDLKSRNLINNFRDIIYVKGSQSTRMERVVKMILAENHDSNIDLVRQDYFWRNK